MSATIEPIPPLIPPARHPNVNAVKKTIESPRLKNPLVGGNGMATVIVTAAVSAINTPYNATVLGDRNLAGLPSGLLSGVEFVLGAVIALDA